MPALYEVVARLGNHNKIPALDLGVIGYDVDKKVFRVGDDTSTPPQIMTDKSSVPFSYEHVPFVEYREIHLIDGGTIDGVTPSLMNASNGMLARIGDNQWESRKLTHDEYITITNPDGVDGNPYIAISDALKDFISNSGGAVKFFFGENPPETPQPGWLFWSTLDFLLYIFVSDSENSGWLDVTSIGTGSSQTANRTYMGTVPPEDAFVGDRYLDEDDFSMYLRMRGPAGLYWVQVNHEL